MPTLPADELRRLADEVTDLRDEIDGLEFSFEETRRQLDDLHTKWQAAKQKSAVLARLLGFLSRTVGEPVESPATQSPPASEAEPPAGELLVDLKPVPDPPPTGELTPRLPATFADVPPGGPVSDPEPPLPPPAADLRETHPRLGVLEDLAGEFGKLASLIETYNHKLGPTARDAAVSLRRESDKARRRLSQDEAEAADLVFASAGVDAMSQLVKMTELAAEVTPRVGGLAPTMPPLYLPALRDALDWLWQFVQSCCPGRYEQFKLREREKVTLPAQRPAGVTPDDATIYVMHSRHQKPGETATYVATTVTPGYLERLANGEAKIQLASRVILGFT